MRSEKRETEVEFMTPLEQRIPYLPPRIEGLAALATNLWWSWHQEARILFGEVDSAYGTRRGTTPSSCCGRSIPRGSRRAPATRDSSAATTR
jgi:hypothetical protein